MKNRYIIFCSLLLVSCFSEPKKEAKIESEPKNIRNESLKQGGDNEVDSTATIVSPQEDDKDAKLLQFEKVLNKVEESESDKDYVITLNNFEFCADVKSKGKLEEWAFLKGFDIVTVENTNDNKEILSTVFHNGNNEFFRFCTDVDFNPVGIISFHPKSLNIFKSLKKECLDRNYTYNKNLKGNILHTKVDANDLIGFSNSLYTVYFSGLSSNSKEHMVVIERLN